MSGGRQLPPPTLPLPLCQVLSQGKLREPRLPVYSNVTGRPYSSAADISAMLCRQLVEPVQWEETLRDLMKGAGGGVGFFRVFRVLGF